MTTGPPQPVVGPQDVDDAPSHHADDEATHADQDTLILDNLDTILIRGLSQCAVYFYCSTKRHVPVRGRIYLVRFILGQPVFNI